MNAYDGCSLELKLFILSDEEVSGNNPVVARFFNQINGISHFLISAD